MFDELEPAFEALKVYDWGKQEDRGLLNPIDDAITTSHGDAAARLALEERLAAVLATDVPRDAKDYIGRKLMLIGTAACVPALAALLPDANLSHMARYALERIPADEAGDALREALGAVEGDLKIGMISSLSARQDEACVPALADLLGDSNVLLAKAAADALGIIGTTAAAEALAGAEATAPVIDASLACAESLLAGGNKAGAMAIYQKYMIGDYPAHVKLGATRGMLNCAAAN
jgi:HEAT repeat protein